MENKVQIRVTIDQTLDSVLHSRLINLSDEVYSKLYDDLQIPIATICWSYQVYYPFG